jgi:hypothetical protein
MWDSMRCHLFCSLFGDGISGTEKWCILYIASSHAAMEKQLFKSYLDPDVLRISLLRDNTHNINQTRKRIQGKMQRPNIVVGIDLGYTHTGEQWAAQSHHWIK